MEARVLAWSTGSFRILERMEPPNPQTLLSDPDHEVRWFVTSRLAFRKDVVVARTLLNYVQDESLDELDLKRVVGWIRQLTGSTFGYSENTDRWQPTLPENRAAIEQFEKWINEPAKPR